MLKILEDLNDELKQIFISGITAKNDERLKNLYNEFKKLSEDVLIFKIVAIKIDELIKNEKNSSILMELSTITYSIMYEETITETKKYNESIDFGNEKPKLNNIKYSELRPIVEILNNKSEKYHKEIKELYDSKKYDDLRLYELYCKYINDKKTYVSGMLENKIMPSIGKSIVPFIKQEIKLNGTKKDAILFKILYEIEGAGVLSLSKLALRSTNEFIVAEAVATLSIEYEDMLLKLINNNVIEIAQAAYEALAKNNSLKGEELIIEKLKKEDIEIISRGLIATKNKKIISVLIDEIKLLLPRLENEKTKTSKLLNILFEKNYREKCNDVEVFGCVLFVLEKIDFYDRAKDLMEIADHEQLYNSFIKNERLVGLAIELATKIYSKEEVQCILISLLKNEDLEAIEEYIKNENSVEFINAMINESRICIKKDNVPKRKIIILLKTLIQKEDINAVEFIKEIYIKLDYADWIFDLSQNAIEQSKTKERDKYLYDLFYNSKHSAINFLAIQLCMKIFSKEKIYDDFKYIFENEEMFEKCGTETHIIDVIQYCVVNGDISYISKESVRNSLMNVEDDFKHWDRRWGKVLTEEYVLRLSNASSKTIRGISCIIYCDDFESRAKLLEFVLKDKGYKSAIFLKILSDGFKLNYPKSNYYFNKIINRAKTTSTKEKIINKLISYGVDENLLKLAIIK